MKINIVIPCYNEQEVLAKTIDVLGKLSERIKQETGADIQLLLVDDGSKDHTWSMIKEAAEAHPFVSGIKLSHNPWTPECTLGRYGSLDRPLRCYGQH